MSTNRIRLVVAYDGTDFCGWAPQAGLRTVQGTLTEAIRRISCEKIEIIGASRTDAGAHAIGQVCHFDCKVNIPVHGWHRAINDLLPNDLSVLQASVAKPEFHARFSARDRWYRYRIHQGPRNPVDHRFSHIHWRPLNGEQMRVAAQSLLGKHDFRSFTAELEPWIENTKRELRKIEIVQNAGETRIEIVGTAFLRGMMRRIAGGLMEVGLGKRPSSDMGKLVDLRSRDSVELPVVLPATGLMLMKVRYGRKLRDVRNKSDEDE